MTLPNRLLLISALGVFPFISFGQESEVQPQVSNIKKITRYAVGFNVELPTMNHVLEYLSEDLGFTIQDVEQMQDPNWNPTSWTTRNCVVERTENGEFVVKMKFYPPVDPMAVEDVNGIQRKSRLLCTTAIEQLKSDQIN